MNQSESQNAENGATPFNDNQFDLDLIKQQKHETLSEPVIIKEHDLPLEAVHRTEESLEDKEPP